MAAFKKISKPVHIPVPGNKMIDEYLGRLGSGDDNVSVARMVAPPGWNEPTQKPEFDEITIMIRGKMNIKLEDENLTLSAGEVILIEKQTEVQYSNPFEEEYECWSICMPAFSAERVNRDN